MKKFWGAEVKPGEPLMVTPEDNLIHLSQASLDCVKGKLMGETVVLSVNVDGTKLVIGTLSQDKFPQISFDLAFEKNFELSHNCTKASVHFMGYKYPVPAPVAANRNAGAAASTVVKADSKPKAKPEEVKPETDDDSDDKDDESHDYDDSVKGMEVDEDDSTDQRTESLFDHNWSSSSEEPDGEEFVDPFILCARNLIPNITVEDIKKFFATIAEPDVQLREQEGGAVIVFSCLEETQAAVRLSGNDLLGRPVYLGRYPNRVRTVCVTGFDPQKPHDYLIGQMGQKLASFGNVDNYFIPRSSTGSYLGFCYLYLADTIHFGDDRKFKSALEKVDRTMGGFEINICHVHLKAWVNNAITEGNHNLVVEQIEALKNAIEDQRAKGVEETDQDVTFSWRNTAGLFFDYDQDENECWAVVLSRGQLAARKIADPAHSSSEPSVETILNGVDSRYLLSGRGIDKMQYARPFMMQHVKDMKIHHKPKRGKLEDFEAFQTDAIHLAKKVPVAVMINSIPGFQSWEGQGIYSPSVIEVCRMAMEKDPGHGLLLCGVGIDEHGVKFLELQESLGEGWGDGGFIKIAYHNYMIKQVIEFKV